MEKNVENQVEETKVEETGVDTQTTEKNEGKAEVEMISKEEAQRMVDGALKKKLPPKEEMEAYKQWKESQKTEADKQAEKEKEFEKARAEAITYKQENAVLKTGVPAEDVEFVMFKVSKMEGEFEDNLKVFLTDNPKYLTKEEVKTTTGVKTQGSITKEDGVVALLKARNPRAFE